MIELMLMLLAGVLIGRTLHKWAWLLTRLGCLLIGWGLLLYWWL